jgi:LysM repeat protein
MNNPSPLVPQGSTTDQKSKGRARVKLAVFFVLAVHGVGLLALLLQGCHREGIAQIDPATNAPPAFVDTTNQTPAVAESTTTQPTGTPPATTTTPGPIEAPGSTPAAANDYTVVSHDTYSTIAKKLGISITALKEANPGVEPTKLQINQKLHIPAATAKVATLTPPAGAPGTSAAPESSGSVTVYKVKSGDTLSKIATAHHISVRALRAANNLKSDRITVGQQLKVQAKAPTPVAANETASATPAMAPLAR